MLRICAVMMVHNAAKTLAPVLAHWEGNRIGVRVIDHGSTDGTADIIRRHRGCSIIEASYHEFDGVFRLKQQLQAKEAIVRGLAADWVIHADGDEIFESPVEGENLRQMIERIDSAGFDVVDCDEFVFVPISESREPKDFVSELRSYYHFSPAGRTLHRAQRLQNASFNWSQTGGHRLQLQGRRLSPDRIRLRYYVGLSFDHLRSQYLGRVFDGDELSRWHHNRVAITREFIVKPDVSKLLSLDQDGWKTDSPEQSHLLFHQPHRYTAPARISAPDTHRPFPFIVGVGRSGTTLLRLLLDAHPELAVTPETHWLRGAIRRLLVDPADSAGVRDHIISEPSWADMGISIEELGSIIAGHNQERPSETLRMIYESYAKLHGATRVGDKTPLHNLAMHDIASILPEAHFIHIIRDGRDVAISYRDLWFVPGRDVREAAMFWMWRIRETRQQAQFLPHYLEVRYEALVTDPERVLKDIALFIDLPYDPVQLTAPTRARERLEELQDIVRDGRTITGEQRRAIHKLTALPPHNSRVGRWASMMTREDVIAFERIAGDMLTDLGYARAAV